MPADDPTKGSPSDHSVPVASPLQSAEDTIRRDLKTKLFRPMPQSKLDSFQAWISEVEWDSIISSDANPSQQVEAFQNVMQYKIDEIFPTVTVRMSPYDKPWIRAELKKLSRCKKREYKKKGKSVKYEKLKAKFDKKFEKAMNEFIQKNITEIRSTNPSKAYNLLKRLGARPSDCDEMNAFLIPSHANLSPEECAEAIATHFSAISQEYDPLNTDNLPTRVKSKLDEVFDIKKLPSIHYQDVYDKIMKARKPKSCVQGDVPSRLVKEFAPDLTMPVTKIFENVLKTFQWPSQWKIEYVTPIEKKPHPESEDELRNISLTHFFSKVLEKFLIVWLLFCVADKIDPGQYGGLRGSSTTHYLIIKKHQKGIPRIIMVAQNLQMILCVNTRSPGFVIL